MIKQALAQVDGIEYYGIISMFIFVSIFAVISVWTATTSDKYKSRMENLPLDN
ncbi:MAG: CcoQ/FixQ family Cbb3-type cytochrome c oxidase assembly chaperone [Candidatus Cloacimonadota bacterium]|nr:MAG: CcoQ/FixQ family Cbb3-type cytochrome c oxidase assembly chaperone [Candidatus Cloacimonadota bacterium]